MNGARHETSYYVYISRTRAKRNKNWNTRSEIIPRQRSIVCLPVDPRKFELLIPSIILIVRFKKPFDTCFKWHSFESQDSLIFNSSCLSFKTARISTAWKQNWEQNSDSKITIIFLSIHLPFFSSRISHRHVVPFSRDGTPEFAFIACHQSHAPLMLTTHLSPFPLLLRRRFLLTPGGSSLSSSSQQRLRHIYQRRPGPINLPWKKEKGGKGETRSPSFVSSQRACTRAR